MQRHHLKYTWSISVCHEAVEFWTRPSRPGTVWTTTACSHRPGRRSSCTGGAPQNECHCWTVCWGSRGSGRSSVMLPVKSKQAQLTIKHLRSCVMSPATSKQAQLTIKHFRSCVMSPVTSKQAQLTIKHLRSSVMSPVKSKQTQLTIKHFRSCMMSSVYYNQNKHRWILWNWHP